MKFLLALCALLTLIAPSSVWAQSTTVENWGVIPVANARYGYGVNLLEGDLANTAECDTAKGLFGATTRTRPTGELRMQCSWAQTEIQSAASNNTGGNYSMPTNCATGIAQAKSHNLNVTVTAAYSPPAHTLAMVTIASAAPSVGQMGFRAGFCQGAISRDQAKRRFKTPATPNSPVPRRAMLEGSGVVERGPTTVPCPYTLSNWNEPSG